MLLPKGTICIIKRTVMSQPTCECSINHILFWYCICFCCSFFSLINYGKCPEISNDLKVHSILFWPKYCFLCSCFLKHMVEWQSRPWSDCSWRKPKGTICIIKRTVMSQPTCECSINHILFWYCICFCCSFFSLINYGKCPEISNDLKVHSILFWPKYCFLCSCFLKHNVEWQSRPWSDCSWRSSLIWVYTVCICHFVRAFGVRNFRTVTVAYFFKRGLSS